ncbi:MAG: PEP-CTERM sorting domain-containing protein [bacterium]
MKNLIPFAALAATVLAGSSSATELLGPSPYLSFSDSPFASETFEYFHLEDFEDGLLNTPGVILLEAGDTSGPAATFSDSVDGDDGSIDGIATGTQSLFSNFSTESFTFDFSAATLGTLPTHAGIVWTDVGRNGGGTPLAGDLIDNVIFEAFGPSGTSLGMIGPFSLGDGSISRTTDEDRFFGVVNEGGISSIRLSMPGLTNWEADHLQYGAVPEPGTALLLGVGLAGLSMRARRPTRR